MSNLTITPQWHDAINQVETDEFITGGTNGNANLATRQLAENIFWLKNYVMGLPPSTTPTPTTPIPTTPTPTTPTTPTPNYVFNSASISANPNPPSVTDNTTYTITTSPKNSGTRTLVIMHSGIGEATSGTAGTTNEIVETSRTNVYISSGVANINLPLPPANILTNRKVNVSLQADSNNDSQAITLGSVTYTY